MAYKMSDVGGWGTGALGDITNPSGQINSYANVTAINTNTVTIGTPSNGIYETFAVGKEILLHVSAVLSGTDATKLGKYLVATITGVAGSVLTLSKDVAANLVANADLSTLVVQAITVAQFNTLTLSSGSITPPVYSTANKYGGIITYKCKTEQIFSGGSISLVDKGIPTASKAMRPLTAQETEMIGTTKNTTGWENHITSRQALMNCGDGVAMIWTKKTTISSASSRIGGATAGVAYYPYAAEDNSPAEVLGGSTILLASETIAGFAVSLISKGKGSGTGYGRCYIATETNLPNDEGLYAQDCLSNSARIRDLGIIGFGDGRTGSITTGATVRPNSYAPITAMGGSRNSFTIGAITAGMYNAFSVSETVCIHASGSVAGITDNLGKFMFAKILGISGNVVTIDRSLPVAYTFGDYYWQMIVVPQFTTFNVSSATWWGAMNVSNLTTWSSAYKAGGVSVMMVNDTLTINAAFRPSSNGSGIPYNTTDRPFAPLQCSGQQKDNVPLSEGHGALIIIAKKVSLGADARIEPLNSPGGDFFGGGGDITKSGYAGQQKIIGESYTRSGGYAGGALVSSPGGPWATNGSYAYDSRMGKTGKSGNSEYSFGGLGGLSLFLVADTLDGFSMKKICTGGGGFGSSSGGSGYGGGIGTNMCAGGPGSCFIYANTLTNIDYAGAVI